MKVWVIGRGYPTKYNKVRGTFEVEQARMLAKAGCEVVYIALVFHPFGKVKKWGYCTWKENDITICTYSQLYAPERLCLHLENFQKTKWKNFLDKIEEQCGKPDVIHVHYPTMITEADVVLSYKEKGVKIVATEHWTKALTGQIKKYQINQMKKYTDQADAFLCVGAPLRDSVKKISGTENNIYVVPDIVSDKFRYKKPPKKSCFEYIAVGRLVPVKQFDKIVEAFAAAFGGDQKEVHLTIVGGGAQMKLLKKLVENRKLQNVVTLTGALSRDDTAKLVMDSDALICYSRLETFGVPVIEAWACGKPVIASDCLGFLEYWDESRGIIVPWNDVPGLTEAMKNMIAKKETYCGEAIARFVQENFSENAISTKLMGIYRND